MAVPMDTVVGSWYSAHPGGGTDQIVYTFLADGTFLVADKGTHERDPSGTSGLEYGTYTWDALSHTLALTFSIDGDGAWGLSDKNVNGALITGDILTLASATGNELVPRILSSPGSIVGSWYATPTGGGSDQVVFTFLADGTYLLADKGTHAHDPTGDSGMEWGTYTWDAATGAFSVQTLVNTDGQWGLSDSHGDVSNITVSGDNLVVNGQALAVRLSPLGSVINGTAGNDTLVGTASNDTLYGLAGNDKATGGYGNDTIDGGLGLDTAMYTQASFNYTVTRTSNGFTVQDKGPYEGTDTLLDIERLHFTDVNVALDLSGNAGNVAKILGAVFDADSVSNRQYAGIGLAYADGGMSYEALMQLAINVRLGATHTHAQVVTLLYSNVVGANPPAADLASYVGLLDGGSYTEGQLGIIAANALYNTNQIGMSDLILHGLDYT